MNNVFSEENEMFGLIKKENKKDKIEPILSFPNMKDIAHISNNELSVLINVSTRLAKTKFPIIDKRSEDFIVSGGDYKNVTVDAKIYYLLSTMGVIIDNEMMVNGFLKSKNKKKV